MTSGRPIRFLSCVTGGWIAARVLLAWHDTGSLPQAIRQALPLPPALAAVPPPPGTAPAGAGPGVTLAIPSPISTRAVSRPSAAGADAVRVQLALLAATRFDTALGEASPATGPTAGLSGPVAGDGVPMPAAPPIRALPLATAPSRLSFSSWLIARDGVGAGSSLSAPQLGGAQGGVRADYAVGGGFALTGRLASPAAGAGREGALGIAWRPAGGPLRIVAEQRVALDGGRGGPALGISGGVSGLPLAAGFRLDGYAQSGAILRGGLDRYADAAVRAARPVAAMGGATIDAGAGAWGGAQRGVTRIDLGPSIGARVPLAGRTLRVSLDWRQRIAGAARPGSGPALSIGSDF